MPFLAELPQEDVAVTTDGLGDQFNKRQDLTCPYCGGTLRFRKAARDRNGDIIRRSHFWHTDGVGGGDSAGGCAKAGESAEHEKWKSIIGELLKDRYPVESFSVETKIGSKVADVTIDLDGGEKNGVVVEYQHKNAAKDYLETTKHYLKYGYSVYWVFNTDHTYDLLFDAKNELKPYFDGSPYLGEKDIGEGEWVKFGSEIWFDNFSWVVSKPEDFNPLYIDPQQHGYSGGVYSSNFQPGREFHVYETVGKEYLNSEEDDIDEFYHGGEDIDSGWFKDPINPIKTWEDVWSTCYTDRKGAGMLSHFQQCIQNGDFELLEPIL